MYRLALVVSLLLQHARRADRLDEQDWFLLKCNFNNLATTSGEHQEYWLLAILAAREASQIRFLWDDTMQCCDHDRGRRQAFD